MTATLGALAWLALVVLIGAVAPVVPTGAAVSAAAALAAHQEPLTVLFVVLAGAVGAYVGDLVVYLVLGWGGERVARRLRWLREPHRLDRLSARVRQGPISMFLLSRLIPGGRLPVLLAAALAGLSWRRFAAVNVPASLLWSSFYAAIGVLGRTIFPEPWQSVVAAVLLVLLITQGLGWLGRRRPVPAHPSARP